MIDALLFEAPCYQGSAVDFPDAFLLATERLQVRDYALMGAPRKGPATPRPERSAPTSTKLAADVLVWRVL
jgi:hypothetical protein